MRVFVSVTFSGSGSDLKEPVIRLNNFEPFSIRILGQIARIIAGAGEIAYEALEELQSLKN